MFNFRLKLFLILINLFCVLFIGTLHSQTVLNKAVNEDTTVWTTGGLYGGYINSLAMATTNPDIIYAGTVSSLFKTTDAGENWTKTGFPEMRVGVVQVAPDNPDIVYAGTDDGIYKSEDGGSSWTQKGLSGARVNVIAIDPLNPHILYAGTGWPGLNNDGEIVGVFKSTDGGATWQEKYSAQAEQDAVMALLIDTDNPSYVYTGLQKKLYTSAGDYALARSTDGGETWFEIPIAYNNLDDSIVALAMTPAGSNPAAIYAITFGRKSLTSGWYRYFLKSTDRGDSWTRMNIDFTIDTSPPLALAVDPNNPNVIYVGTHYSKEELYKSTDGGDTWSIKMNGLPLGPPSSIVIDPRNSAVLYVGFSAGGAYKSTDGAESWNISSQGINNTFINDLAIDPTSSNTAFAAIKGIEHNLAKTIDGGASWDYLVNSPTGLTVVATHPTNPSVMVVGTDYYSYKSSDGGQSWPLLRRYDSYITDILLKPNASLKEYILVATTHDANRDYGVYRNFQYGNDDSFENTLHLRCLTLARHPSNPDIVYVGTKAWGYICRSQLNGALNSWYQISPGGEWVWEVRDIEIDSNADVYTATDEGLRKGTGQFRPEGSVWTKLTGLPTDDITDLAIDRSASPGIIYAGTNGYGVYVSQDGGNTWESFNDGLGNLSILKLTLSNTEPKIIYAGTAYGGVWSRPAFGSSETSVESPEIANSLPSNFELYQNYPNPFNPVTNISYQLPKSAHVNLSIYNLAGQLVETLINENKNAGYHKVDWNVNNISSGIHFYKITVGEFTEVRKCLIVK